MDTGYQQGYDTRRANVAQTRQEAIDLAFQQQAQRREEKLITAHEKGRQESHEQGVDDGFAAGVVEGVAQGRRIEDEPYVHILYGQEGVHIEERARFFEHEMPHRKTSRTAYDQGWRDCEQETMAHLHRSARRERPRYVQDEGGEGQLKMRRWRQWEDWT